MLVYNNTQNTVHSFVNKERITVKSVDKNMKPYHRALMRKAWTIPQAWLQHPPFRHLKFLARTHKTGCVEIDHENRKRIIRTMSLRK